MWRPEPGVVAPPLRSVESVEEWEDTEEQMGQTRSVTHSEVREIHTEDEVCRCVSERCSTGFI